jgi:hypothetical protein
MPIAVYNIVVEALSIFMPIMCIISASLRKYFNSVLTYCMVVVVAKVVQIVVLMLFSHSGTCLLPAVDRFLASLFCGVELACLGISAWVLKRIRRIDREGKALTIIKKKMFLSD